ncbi:hypothetical protein BIU98_00535 [Curtobacterium sp. MMLR14_010]|nr:hypothetical protein BIU98_00535 [Curtobacterium sp. MMLR14_010]
MAPSCKFLRFLAKCSNCLIVATRCIELCENLTISSESLLSGLQVQAFEPDTSFDLGRDVRGDEI